MANVKITDLTAASTPLAGTELFETVQGGDSKKVAASDIGNSATAVPFLSLTGRAYISANSTTDQTGSVSVATPVQFANTAFSAGISIVNDGSSNPTRITYVAAGTYMISINLQFKNTDSADHDVTVWFRLDGTNISNTALVTTVPKAADGGASHFAAVMYVQLNAGQYVDVAWLPEDVAVILDAAVAGAIAPNTPSAILVSERIA